MFMVFEFLYGVVLVLSRCCVYHLVENSLQKKYIRHLCIGPMLFSHDDWRKKAVKKLDASSEKLKKQFGAR